jgi:hypothetical protein
MQPRVYTVAIDNVTLSAAQDIFSLLASASNGIKIHEIFLGATSTSPSALRLRLKRGTTQGSGGTAPTPAPADANDTKSAQSTAHANDTTQATGTFTTLKAWQWDTVLPFQDLPTPEDRICCAVSQSLVFDTPSTPSLTVSGYIVFEEVP